MNHWDVPSDAEGHKRPTILLDIDGVLVNFIGGLRTWLDLYGFTTQENLLWDMSDIGAPENVIEAVATSHMFCQTLPTFPGASHFLQSLRDMGRVCAVTSPWDTSQYWASERYTFLRERFDFAKRDIFIASDKSQIMGDILIDDAPHNVKAFESTGRPAILMARSYNQGQFPTRRVNNYEQCLDLVARHVQCYYKPCHDFWP